MLKVGVIGFGYWGPNIVRNFNALKDSEVTRVCDLNQASITRIHECYRHITTTSDYRDITGSPDIDIVAVVTPVFTHYEIARAALLNGKHVFVEKPFTSTVAEAIDLIEIADKKGLKIMVDHTLLFTGSVRKIKELIDNKELGNIYYYDSTRINLGLFQHDVNVIWDLAPHDLSIMDYIIEDRPIAITANGVDHFKRGLEDVAYITIYFENNIIAHFNMNWLSPVKMRTTVIGGDKKMLIWNDLAADEKIKIYDRGVNIESKEGVYKLLVDYRSGDIWTPKIDMTEALKLEAEYMIDCIYNNITPINDGNAGLSVIRILEASLLSIKNNGKMVNL
ncbi:MAG: Gfo/Idh/MocA family oxidoreductase [Nitrospirae bacterium]|nr:Gfo/Idh/MocA family oxidoreductase [Nitrospirota bacterium]